MKFYANVINPRENLCNNNEGEEYIIEFEEGSIYNKRDRVILRWELDEISKYFGGWTMIITKWWINHQGLASPLCKWIKHDRNLNHDYLFWPLNG